MEEKHCRMCGFDLPAETCSWVEELENEEGGVCLPCVSRFMGHPFTMTREGGILIHGHDLALREVSLSPKMLILALVCAVPEEEVQEGQREPKEVELNRKCRLVGGPRDGELFTEILPVTSYAHVGPPLGVYKFKGDHSSDGREVWVWKEHGP